LRRVSSRWRLAGRGAIGPRRRCRCCAWIGVIVGHRAFAGQSRLASIAASRHRRFASLSAGADPSCWAGASQSCPQPNHIRGPAPRTLAGARPLTSLDAFLEHMYNRDPLQPSDSVTLSTITTRHVPARPCTSLPSPTILPRPSPTPPILCWPSAKPPWSPCRVLPTLRVSFNCKPRLPIDLVPSHSSPVPALRQATPTIPHRRPRRHLQGAAAPCQSVAVAVDASPLWE
jgi:hypothetical protein